MRWQAILTAIAVFCFFTVSKGGSEFLCLPGAACLLLLLEGRRHDT